MMALPGFAKDKRGKQTMKIISYNIEYGMRADTTAGKTIFSTWMRNQDPDIVCLQEANKFTQKSLEALAASYGHPYAVLQKEKGFPTAITSKYPIVNIMKVENNMWHGFVMGTINGYHIISLHLSPHRYESRQLDIDLILETIRQNGPFEKWLIMGDFNSVSPVDAGKYAAFLRNIPFISVPTSSSSDGFSSASASLLVHGKRTSVPAKLAYGIVVDTQIIRTAPEKFIYSGIGDMISKITALYDWIYEEKCGYSTVNDFAVMIAKKAVNSFVRTPYQSIKDELFLKELVDSLAMSGIANEIAGSSAPTSGSEHLISHALDKLLEAPQLHGIQVGIATYIMSKVHNHRYVRVQTVLEETGFFDFAATLQMKKSDFLAAIDLAPSIKPFRHTYLHEEKYREEAKRLVREDEILNRILVD